ncbi:hypothetical protein [Salinispira pacifica]
MRRESILRVMHVVLGLSGLLLIIWWLLLGLTLLPGGSGRSFAAMVLTPGWVPINVIGLVATLLLAIGLSGFLARQAERPGTLGFLGAIVSIAGVVLFGALQFDETFVWPLLAVHAPQLMEPGGPMFTNGPFLSVYLIMGVLFAGGFVLLAVHLIRLKSHPLVLELLLLVGAVLFAGGTLVPVFVRTVGVLLLGASLMWWGLRGRGRCV